MAVDRELRRRVADNLAAFMRGEITNSVYLERAEALWQWARDPKSGGVIDFVRDESGRDNYAAYVCGTACVLKDRSVEGTVSVSRDTWEQMRRTLAFLETEFELEDAGTRRRPGWPVRALLALIAVLLGWSAILYAILGPGIWLAIFIWLSAGPAGMIVGLVWGTRREENADPFERVDQWRKHEHLTGRFNLPAYDAGRHHARRTYAWRECIRESLLDVRSWPLLPIVALLVVYAVVLGPIVVAANFGGTPERVYVVAGDDAPDQRR